MGLIVSKDTIYEDGAFKKMSNATVDAKATEPVAKQTAAEAPRTRKKGPKKRAGMLDGEVSDTKKG